MGDFHPASPNDRFDFEMNFNVFSILLPNIFCVNLSVFIAFDIAKGIFRVLKKLKKTVDN